MRVGLLPFTGISRSRGHSMRVEAFPVSDRYGARPRQ
jgi:hypothetical protein